jgi:hypothetical protein
MKVKRFGVEILGVPSLGVGRAGAQERLLWARFEGERRWSARFSSVLAERSPSSVVGGRLRGLVLWVGAGD